MYIQSHLFQFSKVTLCGAVLLSFLCADVSSAATMTLAGESGVLAASQAIVKFEDLEWSPAKSVNPSFTLQPSDPKLVTHTVVTTHKNQPTKKATIGFNDKGGGYGWSMKVAGYPTFSARELGVPGYGKGLAGSIRDRFHSNRYNPEQAGKWDYEGVVTPVVKKSAGFAVVPQFQLGLYSDGAGGKNELFPIKNYASEFDYSQSMKDASAQYTVPAVSLSDYYVYARTPDAIKQFLSGTIKSGSAQGQQVLNTKQRIKDISSQAGVQTPTDTDLSYLVHSIRGLRVHPDLHYAHYRSNGKWVTKNLAKSTTAAGFTCRSSADVKRPKYTFSSNGRAVPKNIGADCVVDEQLIIFSSSAKRNEGFGIGVYVPKDNDLNKKSLQVVNAKTGTVVSREDRVMQSVVAFDGYTGPSVLAPEGYFFVAVRNYLSGMLSPESSESVHGADHVEALTGNSVVLFGTPDEIWAGIQGDSDPVIDPGTGTSTPMDIIVVGGQSNAVGRGQGSYTEAPLFTNQASRVYQWGRFGADDGKAVLVTNEPLQHWGQKPGIKANEGLKGFAYPFALRYASTLPKGRNVLIVPVAKGSTSILEWDKVVDSFGRTADDDAKTDSTELRDDMVKRIKDALAANPENKIAAVLWQHGEGDAVALGAPTAQLHSLMNSADVFESKLAGVRDDLRSTFKSQGCFPFMIGEMPQTWDPTKTHRSVTKTTAKKEIADAMKAVAENDPCGKSAYVRSFKVGTNADGLHYSGAGQYQLGRNYWGTYNRLFK